MTVTDAEADGRRAIGQRNREAILAGAFDVINRDPEATMNAIADGAGLGRATLYRHFPTRDDLLSALRQRAREQGRAAMVAARPEEGNPIEALQRIVAALFEVVTRNRVLFDLSRGSAPSRKEREKFFAPVTATFQRAQDEGILDPAVSAPWLTNALRSLLRAATTEIEAGRLDRADAPALVVRQLVDGARAR